ncbi:MAG: hypothetical protein AAGM67_04965, partial [Bacteroidota bacterium]
DFLSPEAADSLASRNPITLQPRAKDLQWEIQYAIPIQNVSVNGALLVRLSRNMDDFMQSILREDVFQDFVILKREQPNDSTEEL